MNSLSGDDVRLALAHGYTPPEGWRIEGPKDWDDLRRRRLTLYLGPDRAATLFNDDDGEVKIRTEISDPDFVAAVEGIFRTLSDKGRAIRDAERARREAAEKAERDAAAASLRARFAAIAGETND